MEVYNEATGRKVEFSKEIQDYLIKGGLIKKKQPNGVIHYLGLQNSSLVIVRKEIEKVKEDEPGKLATLIYGNVFRRGKIL